MPVEFTINNSTSLEYSASSNKQPDQDNTMMYKSIVDKSFV